MKKKEKLSNRIKRWWRKSRQQYRFVASNENTLEEEFSWTFAPIQLFIVTVFAAFGIVVFTSLVLLFTPLKTYMPDFVDRQLRKDIVANAFRLDSLEAIVYVQQDYINNIGSILSGEINAEEHHSLDSLTATISPDSLLATERTLQFMQKFEEDEVYNLSGNVANATIPVEGLVFYKPAINGVVSERFERVKRHYGVHILTGKQQPVMATLDGRVVLCTNMIDGYVIIIQHNNNFISIYKHTEQLLKQEGDRVKAGEPIAIVSNQLGSNSESYGFHFELWYKGIPLNPEEYIKF